MVRRLAFLYDAKTLKERISAHVRRTTGHVGTVFEGRFYSGLVEGGARAGELVTLYIDCNPCYRFLVIDYILRF